MYDGLFDYTDGPFSGRCYLTISAPRDGRTTVLLTEIGYPGRTVTNAIEAISTSVIHTFGLNPQRVDWVQYVPSEGYFAVSLHWKHGPGDKLVATAPEWHPIGGNLPLT